MNTKKIIIAGLVLSVAICGRMLAAQDAQAPVVNIDPSQHGNLASAQGDIVDAYQRIEMAQHNNHGELGGHAQKAKDFLSQADAELRAAADFADGGAQPPQKLRHDNPPRNWTIYRQNINNP